MKSKSHSIETPSLADMSSVVSEAMQVVSEHSALLAAINRQRAINEESSKQLSELPDMIRREEVKLALSFGAPDEDKKRAEVEAHRRLLTELIVTRDRTSNVISALEQQSAGIDERVSGAIENLSAYATQLASEQRFVICEEIRTAAQGLAVAIGKARGVGIRSAQPFERYLSLICLPDPSDFKVHYADEGWKVSGRSLLDEQMPGASEARSAVAAIWQPLADAAGALRSCKPVKAASSGAGNIPYVKKGYSIEGVTNPPVYVEEELPLQGFAAYHARGPQQYEIKGDADGLRTKLAREDVLPAELNSAGKAAGDLVQRFESDQASI